MSSGSYVFVTRMLLMLNHKFEAWLHWPVCVLSVVSTQAQWPRRVIILNTFSSSIAYNVLKINQQKKLHVVTTSIALCKQVLGIEYLFVDWQQRATESFLLIQSHQIRSRLWSTSFFFRHLFKTKIYIWKSI